MSRGETNTRSVNDVGGVYSIRKNFGCYWGAIMEYEDLVFKIPSESDDYQKCSDFVVEAVEAIMQEAMDTGKNKL